MPPALHSTPSNPHRNVGADAETDRQTDTGREKKIRVYISDDASVVAAGRKKTENATYSSEIFCFVLFCVLLGWECPHFNAVDVAAANTKKNGVREETEKSKKS